jgi:hypothetical protein
MNFNEINEQSVSEFYQRLAKYQLSLITEKTDDPEKAKFITKQLTSINSLLSGLMRFRNILSLKSHTNV